MPRFGPFAVSFRSALVLLVLAALPAIAADLRPVKEPAKIPSVFAKTARIRMMNVWATWCIPCVAEMPDLRAIDDAFGPELSLIGVSLDDMIPDVKAQTVVSFLDKQRIAFPNVYYTGNPDDLGEFLNFSGEIPITIVFDANGKELWRHQGRLNRTETIARLRTLLRKK